MRDEKRTLKVIRMVCLAVSFSMPALPAYAGYGKITETDTHIYVEYYGDEKDIQASKLLREEEQKKEESAAASKAQVTAAKKASADLHENRRKMRRDDEE